MSKKCVLVVGNVNLETSLQLGTFPLEDASSDQPHGLDVSALGVGFNLARALQVLGAEVRLASVVGSDTVGDLVRLTFARLGMDPTHLCAGQRTGRSLVLSDASGARHVHTDLGGVADASYPAARFRAALTDCGLAVLTNVNYTRPLLAYALTAGVPISTDLHAGHNLNNPYDEAFLAAATLIFFSGEHLPDAFQTVTELCSRFSPKLVIVGLGARGALLSERGHETVHVPAFPAPHVVNTIGAGDALELIRFSGGVRTWRSGRLLESIHLLELGRTEIAERRVEPLAIEEDLGVIEDGSSEFSTCGPLPPI